MPVLSSYRIPFSLKFSNNKDEFIYGVEWKNWKKAQKITTHRSNSINSSWSYY
jgi:hypothetical protein